MTRSPTQNDRREVKDDLNPNWRPVGASAQSIVTKLAEALRQRVASPSIVPDAGSADVEGASGNRGQRGEI
jgi:hypothetical protein